MDRTGTPLTIVTPWAAQGLTTMALCLGRFLRGIGLTVNFGAVLRYEPIGVPEDDEVLWAPGQWMHPEWHEVILVLEMIQYPIIEHARAAGRRVWLVPMWEYLPTVENAALRMCDKIIAPTRCCHHLLGMISPALARGVLDYVPWYHHCPQHAEPRSTPADPTFLHVVRGGAGNARSTEDVVRAFDLATRDASFRGRLTVKTIAPLDSISAVAAEIAARQTRIDVVTEKATWLEVLALVRGADCLVHPSQREGLGLVMHEALAASVPVLTLDGLPHIERITHGFNGFTVPALATKRWRSVWLYEPAPANLIAAFKACTPEALDSLKANCWRSVAQYEPAFAHFWRRTLDADQ